MPKPFATSLLHLRPISHCNFRLRIFAPRPITSSKLSAMASSTNNSSPVNRKVKILMLHGYTQSGPLFHAKTRAHAKLLTKTLLPTHRGGVDLIYPTGPHLLLPADIPGYNPETPPSSSESYGWWTKSTIHNSENGQEEVVYAGLEKGLQTIADAILEAGGIDGVIGFSQGATCAAFVASLLEDRREEAFASAIFPYPDSFSKLKAQLPSQKELKFAISYSGFITPLPRYEGFFVPEIQTPFLHVIGSLDSVVDEGRSVGLVERCKEGGRKVVYHPGGHFVPSGREMNGVLVGFVGECLAEKKEEVEEEESVEDMDVPF